MSNGPEQMHDSREKSNNETAELAAEKLEELGKEYEKNTEKSIEDIETQTEKARVEAIKMAVSVEKGGKRNEKENKPSITPRRSVISKKQKNASFKRTMKRVQDELPTSEKLFSKFIHNDIVEKTSDIVGNTVARPNSILFGAIFAFILTLLTYFIAKNIGYKLSNSETIISFSIGWAIGIIVDYLKALFNK